MNVHNLYKLSTKEDPIHFHKILGGLCLAHYAYRYYLLFTKGTMDLHTDVAYYMVGVHGLLSFSSMIFHIPTKRINGGPMIYPEYRLHSIAFALRSVVCYYLTYHQFSKWWNVAVCFGTMCTADFVTVYLPSGTTTMRQMPFSSTVETRDRETIIKMQSLHQIAATLYMVGNEDACFSPMFATQFAAFLMTLVRKSIISANGWHMLYNFSLWINILCFWSLPINYIVHHIVLIQLFYYWRFRNRETEKNTHNLFYGNKYIGWAGIFVLFFYSRHIWNACSLFDNRLVYLLPTLSYEAGSYIPYINGFTFRVLTIMVYCVYMIYINRVLYHQTIIRIHFTN